MTTNDTPPQSLPPSEDDHMISLYYCYPPFSIPTDQLKQHASFHTEICSSLKLGGRIRVSGEGINGVLSGTEGNLREYEKSLSKELLRLQLIISCDQNDNYTTTAHDDSSEDPTTEWLDIKYCHLRNDVPIEKQLFDKLSVKITREVVSLIEPVQETGKKKGRSRCRQRRKQKKKEKLRQEKLLQEVGGTGDNVSEGEEKLYKAENETNTTSSPSKVPCDNNETLTKELDDVCLEDNQQGGNVHTNDSTINEIGTALRLQEWEKKTAAVHLSPEEWNEKLLQLSQEKQNQQSEISSDDEDNHAVGEGAILLDTRNIYETRVGHFGVPGLETLFPNTRKFSSLPNALNTEEAAAALAGKQVFMYCTGGVRCERAGSYLRALSESNSGAWRGKDRPRGIYQLRGGIQKYLETYGEETNSNEDVPSGTDNATNSNDEHAKSCLYRGKNFVFDPRRTDPVIGNGVTAANNGEHVSLVGRCIVCSEPHDDYDNGHAPCEEKESRCVRCRCLVLVCTDCRGQVRCWGEPESTNKEDGSAGKPELFCGRSGNKCIDEGNIADAVETARF